jgi:hypothetical protein
MGERQERHRIAFVEAVLEVTQDPESVRKYLIEAASTLPATAGALFPLGLGDELYRTGEERYTNWIGYRSADPGPVQALLSTGTPDSIRCAAANPIAHDEWIDVCMRRGENEAGACIAGLAPSRALDAIVRNPVYLPPPAFERLVAVAFCQGPNALARLRSLCLVENFEIYVHNVLGEVDPRIDSLRWYAKHASRDLHRCRGDVLVRDAAAWAEVLRNLKERERGDAVWNLLPGGVIDYLRTRRKDGEDLCGGVSERSLRKRGSWHNASWRGARPRRLTRRVVRRAVRSGEIARAVANILQGHEVTEAKLVRYPKLRELLDTATWVESGTLGGVARQPALLPYALTAMRHTPERYTTYDLSAFWRSMHAHPLEVRVEVAHALPWSLRHADANHVEADMLVAAEGSTWIGEWLDHALCSGVAKKHGAWVHDKVCEAQVANFAAWHLASRTVLLEHVRKDAPDTITTWERTSALLAGWTLPAGKLVDVVARLGRRD